MRRPALLILICYSVAILGMCLIPGVNEEGELVRMSLFDAFYWVSYTATTIGYGEVPADFSKLQRIWVVFSIYYTVPVWFYAAGKIIALLGDPLFQSALELNRFTRSAKKLKQRFFIICGFGEAGVRLTRMLVAKGYSCVVIDENPERIQKILLDPRFYGVLAITGDASNVELLERAGISSSYCRGIVAITNNEDINIQIAIAARLLCSERYRFKIICKTLSEKAFLKAKSFETDLVINTNRVFAERLINSLRRPAVNEILQKLRTTTKREKNANWDIPYGSWILCGYSDLGKSLEKFLEFEGIDTVIISNDGKENHIAGSGSEEATLRKANIYNASAIVACRTDDAENLATVMAAKKMRPSLFVVGKQNHSKNAKLFEVSAFDLVMEDSALLVSEIFPFLTQSMLNRFISLAKHQSNEWGEELLEKITALFPKQIDNLLLKIDEEHSPAVVQYLKSGHILRLQSLWANGYEKPTQDFLPLLMLRDRKELLLPNAASQLQINDRVLLIYENSDAVLRLKRNCYDYASLYSNIHGKETISSPVLNYLMKKFAQ